MKYILSIILFVGFVACSFAQDTLVMRNGDQILGKVEEVGIYEIKYHKAENSSGPIYVAARPDVFMIKYANGARDVFSNAETPADTRQPRQQQVNEPRHRGRREERLRPSYNYVQLNEMAGKRIVAGAVLTTAGGVMLVTGISLVATEIQNSTNGGPMNSSNGSRGIAGAFLTLAGIPCCIIGPVLLGKGFRYRRMAAEQGPSLSFSPVINNPGLQRYGNNYNQTKVGTISITF